MLDFIEQLRKKPEATRARIVFFSAAFVTVIIFLIWLSVINIQFTSSSSPFSDFPKAISTENNTKESFAKLKEDVSEIFSGEESDLQKLKDEISDEILSEIETEAELDPSNKDE